MNRPDRMAALPVLRGAALRAVTLARLLDRPTRPPGTRTARPGGVLVPGLQTYYGAEVPRKMPAMVDFAAGLSRRGSDSPG